MKLAVLRKASFMYINQICLNLDLEYNIWKFMITDIKLKLHVHRPINLYQYATDPVFIFCIRKYIFPFE